MSFRRVARPRSGRGFVMSGYNLARSCTKQTGRTRAVRDLPFSKSLIAGMVFLAGCVPSPPRHAEIEAELEAMSPNWVGAHASTYRDVLDNALAADAYKCMPLPSEVFFSKGPRAVRSIHGTMPHYGFYYGPMHYQVEHIGDRWRVTVRIAVELPSSVDWIELPDCELREVLTGPVECSGIAHDMTTSLEACPDTGHFRAPGTPHNMHAVLERWSKEAESFYNRDATFFHLPITYDFSFEPIDPGTQVRTLADMTVPLGTNCARTPYFQAMRTGWSMPILAHEVAHALGLLDEYEMFSGIVGFYPKTPFPGAERSRMGLSMRRDTVFLPLHHYLILRRFFCPEPETRDPFAHVLR